MMNQLQALAMNEGQRRKKKYERIPRDGNKLLTVIGSVKAIRSTLKNFAARTSNKIVVVDLVSSKIVATANAPR
jgi:uncharacterized protein YkuJ